MTKNKAKALAMALRGDVERPAPTPPFEFAVLLTRPDGRVVLIEEDAGASYANMRAFRVGDSPSDEIEAEEWGEWLPDRHWAFGLAILLGPTAQPWHSGGGDWVVLYVRPDGKLAVIGYDAACVYPDRESYNRDDAVWEEYGWE